MIYCLITSRAIGLLPQVLIAELVLGWLVLWKRNFVRLNEVDVMLEDLVVLLHFLHRCLPPNRIRDPLPSIGRALSVHREGVLEQLVLLGRPSRSGAGRRNWIRCHQDDRMKEGGGAAALASQ